MAETERAVPVAESAARFRQTNAPRARVMRDIQDARAAFEHAVVHDWPAAAETYLAWTDTLYRAYRLGVQDLADVPHFATEVDQLLYKAAAARWSGIDAELDAEHSGSLRTPALGRPER